MFYGRANGVSVTGNNILNTLYSSSPGETSRVSTAMTSSDSLTMIFQLFSTTPTSSGSYVEMYFSP